MGLAFEVGILSDLIENDPEGADSVREHMTAIGIAMTAAGLSPHREPEQGEVWTAEGYGYTGLHALREVAGLVWRSKPISRDDMLSGRDAPNADALFHELLSWVVEKRIVPDPSTGRALPTFAHLVVHSDAEGYYVPTDFVLPIPHYDLDDGTGSIWPLGSVQRLQAELAELGRVLEVPDSLHSEDEGLCELLAAAEGHPDGALWEAQPIATHSLLILREACAQSLKTGAAICFV